MTAVVALILAVGFLPSVLEPEMEPLLLQPVPDANDNQDYHYEGEQQAGDGYGQDQSCTSPIKSRFDTLPRVVRPLFTGQVCTRFALSSKAVKLE